MTLLIMLAAASSTARAQQTLWLSATGSTAQPPADVVGARASTYFLLGLQGSRSGKLWQADGSLSFGNGFQDQAGRWLSGAATLSRSWTQKQLSTRLDATFTGLRYSTPFSYGAYTTQLAPAFTWNATPSASFTVTPQATGGFWNSNGDSGSIGVIGSSVALAKTVGPATLQLSGEADRARNGAIDGNFAGVGFDVAMTHGAIDLGGGVKRWQTPSGHEWGYSAYATRSFGNALRLDVQLVRSVRDPVLATPGSFGASVALNWRIAHTREKGAPPALYTVDGTTANGRRVKFRVTVASAQSVAVSGSFTDWNPVPMRRNGHTFTVDVVVPPGTHQFGFLVDGETWYLPPNATGLVSDDFGRKNATLVI